MGSSELTAGLQPQTTAGQVHSDAVSLEVSLKVHGSKVSAAGNGAAPQTEPFEEQTTSMIVFPHGGVLRMSTAVNAGQMLVLTNLKSRQDAICRVVKVRTYSNTACYVEIEFTHRQPGFWGVYFDADGPAAAVDKVAAEVIPSSQRSSAAGSKIAGAGSPRKVNSETAAAAGEPGRSPRVFFYFHRLAGERSACRLGHVHADIGASLTRGCTQVESYSFSSQHFRCVGAKHAG